MEKPQPNPPFKCSFPRCKFVSDDMGKLDHDHIYCPSHTDGTIIHFNAKSPTFWGGVCQKCGFGIGWVPKTDQVLWRMKKMLSRRELITFVPMESVADAISGGYEFAHVALT